MMQKIKDDGILHPLQGLGADGRDETYGTTRKSEQRVGKKQLNL
jgi:hypothetical protein